MSDHTLKRLTKKFFSPKGSANRLKTTDSEGRLGRKHERSECLTDSDVKSDVNQLSYREKIHDHEYNIRPKFQQKKIMIMNITRQKISTEKKFIFGLIKF